LKMISVQHRFFSNHHVNSTLSFKSLKPLMSDNLEILHCATLSVLNNVLERLDAIRAAMEISLLILRF